MIQVIVPRPVAWVLSDSGQQRWNLAPFSYFNGIASRPPLCMLSIGHKPDGARKDTWVNIDEREEFVVHIASPAMAVAVSESAASLPHGVSEVEVADLQLAAFPGQRLPRVVGPKVALFCRKHRIVEIGAAPQAVVFGEIAAAWLDDAIVTREGSRLRIDARALDPLARLGGDDYAGLGPPFTVERPR
jgi:flavin reductase (DIM6/NTAB) family NADH-FMN oxidoreductase RutF